MDLNITAKVTVLATKNDMLDVADILAEARNGWYGALTWEPGETGPIWRLKVYRTTTPQGAPEALGDIGMVVVTDTNFVTTYPSVDQYNAAHPDNPIPES